MNWLAGQTITAGLLNDVTIQVTTVAGLSGLSPVAGMLAFCTDILKVLVYTGSAWVSSGAAIVADAVTTGSTGTVTSGTSEIYDAVLGPYACTLYTGRIYTAVLADALGSGSVVADLYQIGIRNSGSASVPTTASTLVASTQWYCSATGGAGATGFTLSDPFVAPTTGTNTLGVFAKRLSGSGTMNVVSGGTPRALYVIDLGSS